MLVIDTEFSLLGRIVFGALLVEIQELLQHFSVGFISPEKRDRDGGGLILVKK